MPDIHDPSSRLVTLVGRVKDFLIVDSNHGGYLSGYCLGCKVTPGKDSSNKTGWLEHLEKDPSHHKSDCPVAEQLFRKKAETV
jgi:hypothetical protein